VYECVCVCVCECQCVSVADGISARVFKIFTLTNLSILTILAPVLVMSLLTALQFNILRSGP